MKQYAFLEYTFMFEPSGTWPHLYEFEKDLARFFSEHGFEAEIMKTVEGQSGKRILLIQKKAGSCRESSRKDQEALSGETAD